MEHGLLYCCSEKIVVVPGSQQGLLLSNTRSIILSMGCDRCNRKEDFIPVIAHSFQNSALAVVLVGHVTCSSIL